MPKIYAFLGPNNAINWDTTKAAVASNVVKFADGYHDYGAGNEANTTCPGCRRTLPLALFALDHIRPKSRYMPSSLGTITNSDLYLFSSAGCVRVNASGGSVAAAVEGGVMKIQTGSIYNPKIVLVQSAVLWENDLSNLQFMCPICNSSKNNQTWIEWGKLETDARPLTGKLA